MQSPEYKPTPITESVKPFVQALATAKSKVGGFLRDQPVSPIPGSPKWGAVQDYVKSTAPKTKEEAAAQGMVMIGDTPFDITGMGAGAITKKVASDVAQAGAPLVKKGVQEATEKARPIVVDAFQGFSDLSTKILEKLKGKTKVSKQFISDLTNSPDLKQAERDLIRNQLSDEADVVDVPGFANRVKTELLPLKVKSSDYMSGIDAYGNPKVRLGFESRYENITLPDEVRGKVKNYRENIYESPIKTSAGQNHFGGKSDSYFGHTRIEDMADNRTRRVIEVQSDLYQKGNLEREATNKFLLGEKDILAPKELERFKKYMNEGRRNLPENEHRDFYKLEEKVRKGKDAIEAGRNTELSKLAQYNDPTAHFRMIREEVKKAAQDGKTKLQFPTGETAMKIEGLGDTATWRIDTPSHIVRDSSLLSPDNMKVGQEVFTGLNDNWIITDVLGDGKFKAMPKEHFNSFAESKGVTNLTGQDLISYAEKHGTPNFWGSKEQFDISGRVDQNNPIYKFYEKEVGRYLKNKYGAQLVTDAQGVKWWEVPVSKEQANSPVEAFASVAGIGAASQTGDKKEDRSPAALLRGYLNKNNSMRDMLMQSTGQKKTENRQLSANIASSLLPPAPQATPNAQFVQGSEQYVKPKFSEMRPIAYEIEQEYPSLPPGFIATLIRKESGDKTSDDMNDANRDTKTGDWRWLGGLVKEGRGGSLDQLRQEGIEFDVSTPRGAMDAIAKYAMWLSDTYGVTDPKGLYKLYNGGGTPGAEDSFMKLYQKELSSRPQ